MAKKIDSAMSERLAALGIKKVKTEDEARQKLLKILAENDIDGMEEEDTDSLFDMVESMVGVDEVKDDRTEDEVEADELADEIEDEEDEEPEEETEDEVEEDDEVEDEPEVEEEKPAPKKASKKTAESSKKAEKKSDPKKVNKRGTKLDPKNNKDDRKAFKVFEKFFPADKYEYCWITANGMTIKYKGVNSNRGVLSLDACTEKEGGAISCNVYLLTFTKDLEAIENAGLDYKPCWNGVPAIKVASFDELLEILETLLPEIQKFVEKIDKRLGENRKKMEDSLQKTTKKEKVVAKKTVAKKAEEPEEDGDEIDDEVEQKPAKKAATKKKK